MSQEDTTATADVEADEVTTDDTGGTETEAQTFDRKYVEQLRRENAAARKARQELEQRVQEFEDRDKTEQEKTAERLAAAEKRANEAEARLLRSEVAADKGVPPKLAKFLTGTSKEELEESADEILSEIAGSRRTTSFDGGPRDSETSQDGDMNARLRALVRGK